MGCDIHGWVEVKINGKYVAIEPLKDDSRNYRRFAELASVRGEGPRKPLGIPEDVSETTKYHIEKWGADGHSHSYLPISEAAQIFLKTKHNPSDFDETYPELSLFGVETTEDQQARLVFWFDN